MIYCFIQKIKKQDSRQKYSPTLLPILFAIYHGAFANQAKIPQDANYNLTKQSKPPLPRPQVGDNYFETKPTSTRPGLQSKTLSLVGLAVEEHQSNILLYAFMNQLFANQIYYELRAYTIYNYLYQNTPAPPIVPEHIPVSSEHHVVGYGGVGILGYNVIINNKLSFLPFIRLQTLTNSVFSYEDSFGNAIHSVNYTAFLGGRLSMRVNDVFAIFTQYYGGYQRSVLLGSGVYSNTGHPAVNGLRSIFEFGTPYNINKLWSITPYIQYLTNGPSPNQAARNSHYSINQLTNTATAFAIKVGYAF